MAEPPFPGAPAGPDSSDADADATVMIPRPGGRRASPAAAPAAGSFVQSQPMVVDAAPSLGSGLGEPPPMVGVNPLVANAAVLLNAVPTIRRTLNHANPSGLRDFLLRAISDFEHGARRANVSPEHVLIARYAMCTMIDEAVATMPWGSSSAWSRESLLVTLHKETFGGEKFFQLLDKALEDPRRNLDLLELLYCCLALGFEGRYRVVDNGRAQLDALRDRLLGVIKRERGEFERDLSPHWRGLQKQAKPLVRRVPPWIVFASAALLLFASYFVFVILLARDSDTVFSAVAAIRADPGDLKRAAAPLPSTPVAAPAPRLRPLLTAEIQQGLLDVQEDETTSHVVIRGDQLYEPGGVDIRPTLRPVIDRVAAALNQVPGVVTVTGHTDNQPIRSLRFPSNYELSLERAKGMTAQLSSTLADKGRIKAEGLADAKPLAPNTTPEGRARNRRVEITLRSSGA